LVIIWIRKLLENDIGLTTYLNRVDIVGDANERGLFLLDQSGDGVDTVVHDGGTLGRGVLLASGAGLGTSTKTLFLLLLGLGTVLVQELEQLSGYRRKEVIAFCIDVLA
jgi:hypothetical protein